MSISGDASLDAAGVPGAAPLPQDSPTGPESARPASEPPAASAPHDTVRSLAAVPSKQRIHRGLTIRLKLTLWYGLLFLLGGVILIAANYFMVRNSLAVAPEKARAAVEQRFGLEPGSLEFPRVPGVNPGQMERNAYIEVNPGVYVPLPSLIDQAQQELRAEALRQLWTRSLLALAIMAVVVFTLSWLLAGRMLRPLHAITSTARRLSGSTLHERINLRGPRDELKELADTFDDMLGRLDTAFTAQREFVANASHELRTPLTIIRTEVDVALSDPDISPEELQETGAAITEAVDRSEGLIDGLLVLASADAEGRTVMTHLDLAEIAENEVDVSSAEADALGLRLELALQPAPVQGEQALLERLVGNLVENSIRHNVADGWFSVRTATQGDKAVLTVANSGPVLPPEELGRLFDRFYRPDRSRSRKTGGFGLGLSIVKSVATAHGGTVDLKGLAEGGLEVTVALPLGTPRQSEPATNAVNGGGHSEPLLGGE
jgi:signal transduction histidine kinase